MVVELKKTHENNILRIERDHTSYMHELKKSRIFSERCISVELKKSHKNIVFLYIKYRLFLDESI